MTRGFQKDVGNRTTHHFLYPESAVDVGGGISLVLLPFKLRDLEWLTSALSTGEVKMYEEWLWIYVFRSKCIKKINKYTCCGQTVQTKTKKCLYMSKCTKNVYEFTCLGQNLRGGKNLQIYTFWSKCIKKSYKYMKKN